LVCCSFLDDATRDRSHPLVIALFDEKGSEWSSGKFVIHQKVSVPPGFAKFATIVQDKGESIHLNFDCAPAAGMEDLMKQPNASMDNVRALHAKIEAAKNVWERFGPINKCHESDVHSKPCSKAIVVTDEKTEKVWVSSLLCIVAGTVFHSFRANPAASLHFVPSPGYASV
jgi:hypothetical protein